MFRKIRETLFVSSNINIDINRKREYYFVLGWIVGLHILGLICVLIYSTVVADENNSYLMVVCALLQVVSFVSGLFLFVLSLKSETLIAQTYKFAAATAQASTHTFTDFKEHLAWLVESLSPESYNSTQPNLMISVSTPVYGIGDGINSASLYLKYFESWVLLYEQIKTANHNKPNIELCVWNKEDNINTFKNNFSDWSSDEKKKKIIEYANLLSRLNKLHIKGFINLQLYFTDRTDTRIFMASCEQERKYNGIMVVFSPLTESAVKNQGWTLAGFSFWEQKSFKNVYNFNFRLMHRNHEEGNGRLNQVELLKDPVKWLNNHYGLE